MLIGLLMAMGGCADPRIDELKAYADQVMSRPGGVIEPLPEFRIVGNYLYRSADEGLRDPFEPFVDQEKKLPTAVATRDPQQEAYEFEVKVRPKEELESFELDSLRMVGTMLDLTDRPPTPQGGLPEGPRGAMEAAPLVRPPPVRPPPPSAFPRSRARARM
jgi:Tfp pilus assembly protein PilP